MYRRIAISVCLGLAAMGCNKDQNQQATIYDKQQLKPIVALVPLIDNTVNDVPWSLSEELTSAIYHRLSQRDKLYLVDLQKVRAATRKLNNSSNPFGANIAWVKKAFPEQEFVVFMELLQHEELPVQASKISSPEDTSAELTMKVRIRVVDVRTPEPKVVLQEIVQDSHYIPKQFTRANFFQVPWGKESYHISPLGLAHTQLSKEIAGRLEDYILLSKTK